MSFPHRPPIQIQQRFCLLDLGRILFGLVLDDLTIEQVDEYKAHLASAEAREADLQAICQREQLKSLQQNAAGAECARLSGCGDRRQGGAPQQLQATTVSNPSPDPKPRFEPLGRSARQWPGNRLAAVGPEEPAKIRHAAKNFRRGGVCKR